MLSTVPIGNDARISRSPAEPDAEFRRAHFRGHVQEKDDNEHQECQADQEAQGDFQRPDASADQAESRASPTSAINV